MAARAASASGCPTSSRILRSLCTIRAPSAMPCSGQPAGSVGARALGAGGAGAWGLAVGAADFAAITAPGTRALGPAGAGARALAAGAGGGGVVGAAAGPQAGHQLGRAYPVHVGATRPPDGGRVAPTWTG